ncbi:MAG: hypothetical protein ABIU09_09320, partial [Pyrinomonadaceae bacterium]
MQERCGTVDLPLYAILTPAEIGASRKPKKPQAQKPSETANNGNGPKKPKPPAAQSLQVIKKNDQIVAPGSVRRVSLRMTAFLRAYEGECGNISVACGLTGVSRTAYY